MKTDRVVVVTGGAGGIGSAIVERFLANGDTVIATDASEEAIAALKESNPSEKRLLTVAADISEESGAETIAAFAKVNGGRVDVLVNCAGFFPFQRFEDMKAADWRRVININLTGTFLVTSAILPLMKDLGWGRIISFGSGAYFVGVAGQAHYVAAKAGVVGFSRSIARELGDYGITVNVITPGVTLTPNAARVAPAPLLEAQRRARAIHRDQYPADLVGAVAFLASPDADFITAQVLNVDGGINAT